MNDYPAAKPKMVLIELTSKCNLDCGYCFKSKINYPVKEMSRDTLHRVIDNITGIKYVTLCGMGEQFLHPGIYDFMEVLKDKKVTILTNGTIPIDYERILRTGNLESLNFSIDGPNEEVIRRSCPRYRLADLRRNLEGSLKYDMLWKSLNYVMGPDNLQYTLEIFTIIEEYRFQILNLLLPTYNLKWIKANLEVIREIAAGAIKLGKSKRIYVDDPFTAKCGCFGAPVASIDCSGTYRPCCDPSLRKFSLGRISTQSFENIWSSSAYDKFKKGQLCRTCVYTTFKNFSDSLTKGKVKEAL